MVNNRLYLFVIHAATFYNTKRHENERRAEFGRNSMQDIRNGYASWLYLE